MHCHDYMDRLQIKYKTPYIQIPNNLITEVNNAMKLEDYQAYSHYAYCFIIANAFLYKYAHYVDFEHDDYINITDIKELLKYNPKSQKINKVSKRDDGILEAHSLIESTTDIPISVEWEDSKSKFGWKERKIITLSESDEYVKKALYSSVLRTPRFYSYIPEFMMDYKKRDGALNDYSNTYRLSYKEFRYFLFSEEFTLRDFYFYLYIKSKKKKNGKSDFSYDTAQRQTGMSQATIKKVSEKLQSKNIITVKDNPNVARFRGSPKTYRIKKSYISRD